MGFWSNLFGRRSDEPIVVAPGTIVLRRAELVQSLQIPEHPNFANVQQEPCERCGADLREVFITTGGPHGDPDVWRDHPVAVDGWACGPCGVFRYPRRMAPERIHEITEQGAAHGRAGRFADAELCFARITWDWPGYFMGHMNYAEATRDRIASSKDADAVLRRRLVDRMSSQYELAVASYEHDPERLPAAAAARAYVTIAQIAIERKAFDKAQRMIDRCLALPELGAEAAAEARGFQTYIEERHDLFEEAAPVIEPYMNLAGRPGKPIETGAERKRLVEAVEKMEAHFALAPSSWRAGWLLAKGKGALGDKAGARTAWRLTYEAAPLEKSVAKDYGLDLLEQGAAADALPIARAIADAYPDDAELWCNLAVTELLAGDLAAASKSLAKSIALDPKDPIARAVEKKLAVFQAGAPIPRTLRDLSRA